MKIINLKRVPAVSAQVQIVIMMIAALIVRLWFAASGLAFSVDLNTFKAWADLVFHGGMRNFYFHGAFTDYPPGYIYVLFVLGWLRYVFDIYVHSRLYDVMMMMPAILADLATGYVIYRLTLKKLPSYAMPLAAAYLFNPVIILDSAVWAQVDSVYLLPIIVSVVLLTEKRYMPAYLLYALAIMIKPQSLILAPLYLHSFFVVLQDTGNVKATIVKLIYWGAACAALMLALMLPFVRGFNIMPILEQYAATLGSYPFASLNAYNFHALVGGMWQPMDMLFLGVPLYVIGYSSIVLVTFLSLYLMWRDGSAANIFYVAALLSAVVFVFSVRMHERYLYPAVPLLLIVYIYRPDRRILALFGAFSLTFTVNVIDALRMLNNGVSLHFLVHERWVSALNVVLVSVMVVYAFKIFGGACKKNSTETRQPAEDRLVTYFEKYEWQILAALVIVYAVVAFTRLGDMHAPQSFWDQRVHREEADWHTGWHPRLFADEIVDMGQQTFINELRVYLGPRHDQQFDLFISDDGEWWEFYRNFFLPTVFFWHDFDVNIRARYLLIRPQSESLMIGEIGLKQFGQLIKPVQVIAPHSEGGGTVSAANHPLFDEQHTVPAYSHFMNSTYFDEIYHPRTAYEFIHGMFVYENTHPPLGKVIMSWGIRAFGMTPFGWRFAGTFVGVLMIIPFYLLARELFEGKRPLAFVAAGLFTFDFMHFAQTRIATIDTYVTFFVILMYLFMYMYYKGDACIGKGDACIGKGSSRFRKDMLWLFLSGLCMGLGIASKWQGVYAAAGLALLWLIVMVRHYMEYRAELAGLHAEPNEDTRNFPRIALKTIGMCVLFFVVVPTFVYMLSYIDYIRTPWMDGMASIIANQVHMYSYHAGIYQSHPFESAWWEWPFNVRPMFYYSRRMPWLGISEGISSFGNPIVWWGGLVGMVYVVYRLFNKHRPRAVAVFLAVSFAAQYVPWMLVPRTTYIYHYFPSVPFITLALAYMIGETVDAQRPYVKYAVLVGAVALFVMFYPVLSGLAVSTWYVDTFLRWMNTWVLI